MQSRSAPEKTLKEVPNRVGDASLSTTVSGSVSSTMETVSTPPSSPEQEREAAMVLLSLNDTGRGEHLQEAEDSRLEETSAALVASAPPQDDQLVWAQSISTELTRSCQTSIRSVHNGYSDNNKTKIGFIEQHKEGPRQIEKVEDEARAKLQPEEGAMSSPAQSNYVREAIVSNIPTRQLFRSAKYEQPIPPCQIGSALVAGLRTNNSTPKEHGAFVKEYRRYPKRFDIIAQSPELVHRSCQDLAKHYYTTKLTTNYMELQLQASRLRPRKSSTIAAAEKKCRTEIGLIAQTFVLHRNRKRATPEEETPKAAPTRRPISISMSGASEPSKPLEKRKRAYNISESMSLMSDQRPEGLSSAMSVTTVKKLTVSSPQTDLAAPRKRGKRQKQPWPPISLRRDNGEDPPYPYALLIAAAIHDSQTQSLSLNQIYRWISGNFSFFQTEDEDSLWYGSWTNSIRHTTSHNPAFGNQSRPHEYIRGQDDTGMGGLWIIKGDTPQGQKLLSELDMVNNLPSALVVTHDHIQDPSGQDAAAPEALRTWDRS